MCSVVVYYSLMLKMAMRGEKRRWEGFDDATFLGCQCSWVHSSAVTGRGQTGKADPEMYMVKVEGGPVCRSFFPGQLPASSSQLTAAKLDKDQSISPLPAPTISCIFSLSCLPHPTLSLSLWSPSSPFLQSSGSQKGDLLFTLIPKAVGRLEQPVKGLSGSCISLRSPYPRHT